ncbi:hypothetical protein, partial [Klebsiella pneumoniae]|uniref:hypothetical protein n=1 Tax=Klebsiella pneumoniae TaxID=573 RepID=UPI003EC0560F
HSGLSVHVSMHASAHAETHIIEKPRYLLQNTLIYAHWSKGHNSTDTALKCQYNVFTHKSLENAHIASSRRVPLSLCT